MREYLLAWTSPVENWNKALQDEVDHLDREKWELKRQNKALQDHLDHVKRETREIECQNKALQDEVDRLEREQRELERSLKLGEIALQETTSCDELC